MAFLYSNWRRLPLVTRHKIAVQFSIGKTRPTHVANNELVDDGYELKHIEERLTISNLQAYLNSTSTDEGQLWHDLVEKIEGRAKVEVVIPVSTPVTPPVVVVEKTKEEVVPKKRGRKPKVRADV